MKRVPTMLAVIASLAVLAGCTVTVDNGGDPFDPTTNEVTATTNPEAARDSITLEPDEVIWYEVHVPSSVANSGDLLWLEIAPEGFADTSGILSLRLYSSSGTVRATSISSQGFGPGTTYFGAGESDAAFDTTAIQAQAECRGPCIILPAATATELIRIENVSSNTVEVDLYAFVENYSDDNEPENNNAESAATFGAGDVESGAIETIGDIDWYRATDGGTLNFGGISSADLVADIWDGEEFITSLQLGDSYSGLRAGDEIAVYSESDFAGPPAGEGTYYSLDIE